MQRSIFTRWFFVVGTSIFEGGRVVKSSKAIVCKVEEGADRKWFEIGYNQAAVILVNSCFYRKDADVH